MKKIMMAVCLTLIFILVLGSIAAASNTVKLGYDFSGKMKGSTPSDANVESDVNDAINVGYEYTVAQERLEYGFGLEYQFERALKSTDAKFNFVPVYALLNYNFGEDGDVQPYITARLGYNFLIANDVFRHGHDPRGGLYYGAGFGITISNQVKLEALYSENRGYLDGGNDIVNHQVSFNIGFKF